MRYFGTLLAGAVGIAAPGVAAGAPAVVLHEFTGSPDGARPTGNVVVNGAGQVFGTTLAGGAAGLGTVFRLSPPGAGGKRWTSTLLYSFDGTHGAEPYAAPVLGSGGTLYLTTAAGGGRCKAANGGTASGCGQVVALSPPAVEGGLWQVSTLHQFVGGDDGAAPLGPVVSDSAGNLYVATYGGGGTSCSTDGIAGCGTVVELSPPDVAGGAWTEAVLFRFPSDGSLGTNPVGLARDAAGVLYVVSQFGGAAHVGTLMTLTAPVYGTGWTPGLVYSFDLRRSGVYPVDPPVLDSAGRVYVSTVFGFGHSPDGAVTRLAPPAFEGGPWQVDLLHAFKGGPGGAGPEAPMITGDGTILLTTFSGGTSGCGGAGCGTLVSLTPKPGGAGAAEQVLFRFRAEGAYYPGSPDGAGALATDRAGNLYATTDGGQGAVVMVPGAVRAKVARQLKGK
jgi:uncharacterized repeat protein (TIGR03803 family)